MALSPYESDTASEEEDVPSNKVLAARNIVGESDTASEEDPIPVSRYAIFSPENHLFKGSHHMKKIPMNPPSSRGSHALNPG